MQDGRPADDQLSQDEVHWQACRTINFTEDHNYCLLERFELGPAMYYVPSLEDR